MDYYPDSYKASRERFQQSLSLLQSKWPDAHLERHPSADQPDLSIDWLWADARQKKNLVIVTTGLHGIEGYVGSAVQKLFLDEFMPRLDPENTGLLLVHAINPWGMQQRRRYNENNVDLNRNFIWDEHFKPELNPDYDLLVPLLNSPRPLGSLFLSDVAFIMRLLVSLVRLGVTRIRLGMLSGQYRQPRGVQFGGQATQQSTRVMRNLFAQAFEAYEQVIHIDLHSGYGPRYQMSMVNATREPAPASELMQRFGYPLIVAANPSDFYTVIGDITEYIYQLRDEKYPSRQLFGTCFEFGTFGDSLLMQIRSMRATILENRVYQYGAKSRAAERKVKKEYGELFFPSESRWREKVMDDARQAFAGILRAYELFD
jgi:predicted deacylase